jgi:hypothetical protein
MAGEQVFDLRLSPSGPFVQDAVSGMPAQVGTGTPGLVWRGLYSGTGTDIGNGLAPGAQVALPGMGGAWDIPRGYHYDIGWYLAVQGANTGGGTVADIIVRVEGSVDNGATWFTLFLTIIGGTVAGQNEATTYLGSLLDVQLAADLTNVRTVAGSSAPAGAS